MKMDSNLKSELITFVEHLEVTMKSLGKNVVDFNVGKNLKTNTFELDFALDNKSDENYHYFSASNMKDLKLQFENWVDVTFNQSKLF